ncbi:MAG: protein-glutamate O-methyltransferase CheR [Thermodesulfovibrionales bacterium]|nr:protein-glutamate O-methyltransferase CheR [Thermodesulfovibrionales bacterium]
MSDIEESIPLSDEAFRLLRDLIKDYCGVYFDDSSKYLLSRRLSRRLRVHHLDNFRDYYRLLLYDRQKEEELSAAMDILTVNETYFFREESQLKALSEEILKEVRLMRGGARKLRIWSAGCSSGEEPYTIAMLILEQGGMFDGWDIEVLGSDINQRVLQAARRGIYRKNSFRTTDEYFIKKYFTEEDGLYKVNDSVRRLVNFSYLNLLDPFKIKFVGTVDVVLCRNVLIYFHIDARKRVIENFYQRLSDGGYLLLGHAESLMNISTAFTLKHLKNDMVYQKPKKIDIPLSDSTLFKMVWGR